MIVWLCLIFTLNLLGGNSEDHGRFIYSASKHPATTSIPAIPSNITSSSPTKAMFTASSSSIRHGFECTVITDITLPTPPPPQHVSSPSPTKDLLGGNSADHGHKNPTTTSTSAIPSDITSSSPTKAIFTASSSMTDSKLNLTVSLSSKTCFQAIHIESASDKTIATSNSPRSSTLNAHPPPPSFKDIFYIIYAVGWLMMMMIIIMLIICVFINGDYNKSIMTIIWLMSYITLSYGADYAGWSVGGSTMPRGTDNMAVGYDSITDKIWILGGWSTNSNQLVSFHNNTFTDYGVSYFSSSVLGLGQFYTQIGNILYMCLGTKINTFNVETLQFQYGYNVNDIPRTVLSEGCLTSISNGNHVYLIVNGGYNYGPLSLNETQILNLTSNDWLLNVPGMQHKRARHSCMAHNEYIYAFGGLDFGGGTSPSTSIELLFVGNLINIQNEQWNFMDDLVSSLSSGHRSIVVNDDIIIFGSSTSQINVIHTTTKTVSSGGVLQYATHAMVPIFVYPFIYVVGGSASNTRLDTWQYHELSATPAPTQNYNNWIAPSSPLLPRTSYQMAAGYDSINNRIWLVGDWQSNPQQLTSYDIDSNSFTDYGTTALSNGVWGVSDYYTQIDDILYMVDPDGDKFSTFNVKTAQFVYNAINIPSPVYDGSGCLTSIDDYLIVFGETGSSQRLKILNLTNSSWIRYPSVDWLRDGRLRFSCIVHPYNKALYAIGGWGGSSGIYHETIEKLYVGDLVNIENYGWKFIDSFPFTETQYMRSVIYGNDIICIGSSGAPDQIFAIDVTTDTVRSAGFLDFGAIYVSLINVNDVLYSFGGFLYGTDCCSKTNKWQYWKPPTPSPTNNPTLITTNPTLLPTNHPTPSTNNPSLSPTNNPTPSPTKNPTPAPTNNPTPTPTDNPTPASTTNPTPTPTANPTDIPSPTVNPTNTPSSNPSSIPTKNPTSYPTYNPTPSPSNYPTIDSTSVLVFDDSNNIDSNNPTLSEASLNPSYNLSISPSIAHHLTCKLFFFFFF